MLNKLNTCKFFVMGDQLHLFVFHIPGNLPCNLETLENTEFTLSSEGKKVVSQNSYVHIFISSPHGQMSHG